MKDIIQIASAEIGVEEVVGRMHNERIIQYAKEAGFEWVSDDETPWCSIFVNWLCYRAGLERSHKATARSWVTVGKETKNPQPGDIVVFWRGKKDGWKGHVGLFFGYSKDGKKIFTLGGNQGNKVSIIGYSSDRLLGFRRIQKNVVLTVPSMPLKRGDSGDDVEDLQNILNSKGHNCGKSDGDYGRKTTSGVRSLQMNEGLVQSGDYDESTIRVLTDLIAE